MTQRQKVLQMLTEAGPKGVRSDEFFKAYMPRAGARIHELRSEGFEITSEQERQFVRYKLVGDRAGGRDQAQDRSAPVEATLSSVAGEGTARSVPSMFDCDVSWEDAA